MIAIRDSAGRLDPVTSETILGGRSMEGFIRDADIAEVMARDLISKGCDFHPQKGNMRDLVDAVAHDDGNEFDSVLDYASIKSSGASSDSAALTSGRLVPWYGTKPEARHWFS